MHFDKAVNARWRRSGTVDGRAGCDVNTEGTGDGGVGC